MTEPIVDADADDVVGDLAADGPGPGTFARAGAAGAAEAAARRGERRVDAPEIDVEIFRFQAPIAEERLLDAGAEGPAHLDRRAVPVGERAGAEGRQRGAARRHAGQTRVRAGDDRRSGVVDLTVSQTAGRVDERAIVHEPEPAAQGPEPRKLFRIRRRHGPGIDEYDRGGRDVERLASPLPGAVDVGLEAEQVVSRLPVVAGLHAAEHAVHMTRIVAAEAERAAEAAGRGTQRAAVDVRVEDVPGVAGIAPA